MTNERLTAAVTELQYSRRLVRRFRRDPARAMRRFALSSEELGAVKDGDAEGLLDLGLDPECVWPREPVGSSWRRRLVKGGARFSPFAFAALVAGLLPTAALARRREAMMIIRCARLARTCDIGSIKPPPGGISLTRTDLKDACKDGGFNEIGFGNQGQCVSFVNHTFPDGFVLMPTGGA